MSTFSHANTISSNFNVKLLEIWQALGVLLSRNSANRKAFGALRAGFWIAQLQLHDDRYVFSPIRTIPA